MAGLPPEDIAHGGGNCGDGQDASVPRSNSLTEVHQLITKHLRADLDRAAQSHVREKERRERRGRGK